MRFGRFEMRSLVRNAGARWFGSLAGALLGVAAGVGGMGGAEARAAAEPVDLIINVDNRETVSLNGDWKYTVDPYEVGYWDYRYQPSDAGFFRDAPHDDASALIEYNFDTSPALKVPGDWNTQRDELLLYEGTVWYRRKFGFTPGQDERVFLHFGAANYEARVYLNGEQLGRHVGGFTPFQFEVTGKLRDGENSLVVKVDNTRRHDAIPTVNTDWWNYGGLTRRVMLVRTPRTFVRDYMIQLDPQDPGTIRGWVRVDGPDAAGEVRIEIPEAGLSHTVTTDGSGFAEVRMAAAGLELWRPGAPKLYDVSLTVGGHELVDQIGFRTVATRGTEILLNGEPLFLRGISIHEEAPLRGGRAYSVEDARTLLGWAEDLGCNFVRLAHYPHHEGMVREADRRGLLVWSEVPVYWTIDWENPETYANARRQLSEMIARDRNRAAVILWSVANETPVTDRRLEFLRGLIDTARGLDPTRLVTAALEKSYRDRTTVVIEDPLAGHLDVLGCNEYIGWYDGLPPKASTVRWVSDYDKPLIMSELGGGALAGRHGDETERWTEEFQAALYRHQTEMLSQIPFLAGTTPWILMDFRSPRRLLPEIQDFWNRKGLLSERGERKQAFDVLRAFYEQIRDREEAAR